MKQRLINWTIKALLKLTKGKDGIHGVKVGEKKYVITVEEYIPIDEQLSKWQACIEKKGNDMEIIN